eukprot:Nk52_evm11s348 gene=Nk52_evmTU11s348
MRFSLLPLLFFFSLLLLQLVHALPSTAPPSVPDPKEIFTSLERQVDSLGSHLDEALERINQALCGANCAQCEHECVRCDGDLWLFDGGCYGQCPEGTVPWRGKEKGRTANQCVEGAQEEADDAAEEGKKGLEGADDRNKEEEQREGNNKNNDIDINPLEEDKKNNDKPAEEVKKSEKEGTKKDGGGDDSNTNNDTAPEDEEAIGGGVERGKEDRKLNTTCIYGWGNTCYKCHPWTFSYNGTCNQNCPDGLFPIFSEEGKGRCEARLSKELCERNATQFANCQLCSDDAYLGSLCELCSEGYKLNTRKQCVKECPALTREMDISVNGKTGKICSISPYFVENCSPRCTNCSVDWRYTGMDNIGQMFQSCVECKDEYFVVYDETKPTTACQTAAELKRPLCGEIDISRRCVRCIEPSETGITPLMYAGRYGLECHERCPQGTELDKTNTTWCVEKIEKNPENCHHVKRANGSDANCKWCNGKSCLKCPESWKLSSSGIYGQNISECVEKCPFGSRKVDVPLVGAKCSFKSYELENCASKDPACVKCIVKPSYRYDPPYTECLECNPQHKNNHLNWNGTCIPRPYTPPSCSGGCANCTSGGNCTLCSEGFLLDHVKNQCFPKNLTCHSHFGVPKSSCKRCHVGAYLYNNKCYAKCPEGTYTIVDTSLQKFGIGRCFDKLQTNACAESKSMANCKLCAGEKDKPQCALCAPNYKLVNGKCLKECPHEILTMESLVFTGTEWLKGTGCSTENLFVPDCTKLIQNCKKCDISNTGTLDKETSLPIVATRCHECQGGYTKTGLDKNFYNVTCTNVTAYFANNYKGIIEPDKKCSFYDLAGFPRCASCGGKGEIKTYSGHLQSQCGTDNECPSGSVLQKATLQIPNPVYCHTQLHVSTEDCKHIYPRYGRSNGCRLCNAASCIECAKGYTKKIKSWLHGLYSYHTEYCSENSVQGEPDFMPWSTNHPLYSNSG